jgi:hypothetical protein
LIPRVVERPWGLRADRTGRSRRSMVLELICLRSRLSFSPRFRWPKLCRRSSKSGIMPFSRLLQMHSQVSHMSTRASRREREYTRRCVRRRPRRLAEKPDGIFPAVARVGYELIEDLGLLGPVSAAVPQANHVRQLPSAQHSHLHMLLPLACWPHGREYTVRFLLDATGAPW